MSEELKQRLEKLLISMQRDIIIFDIKDFDSHPGTAHFIKTIHGAIPQIDAKVKEIFATGENGEKIETLRTYLINLYMDATESPVLPKELAPRLIELLNQIISDLVELIKIVKTELHV
ncbi:MAG: hypothetical protein ACXAE3_09885 [Candidatus Kariarchaeaceae archaeon]|jgi:hypothetical protein